MHHEDDEYRKTILFRGLAKIMLSLVRVPLPRVGSWTMDDPGILSLTNRPLSDLTMFWNRHKIPMDIPRVRRTLYPLTFAKSLTFGTVRSRSSLTLQRSLLFVTCLLTKIVACATN